MTTIQPMPETPFGYPILVADDFEHVLSGIGREFTLEDFADLLAEHGRVLLQARGGAGKTITARRLAGLYEANGLPAAFVPAWAIPDQQDWLPGLNLADLASVAEEPGKAGEVVNLGEGLVVIDGINEISRDKAGRIFSAILFVGAAYPFVQVIVTDRLTRRDIAPSGWTLATLGPVPEDEARRHSGRDYGLLPEHLTVPFYLDRSDASKGVQGQSEILHEAVVTFGVTVKELPALAEAAFDSYELRGDRILDRAKIQNALGPDAWNSMRESRLVVGDGSDSYRFSHHLAHDYLAGLHLASHPELWTPNGFDVVTLKASSFDALALAAANVHEGSQVDDFVHKVFDWNFYGAAYLLEEDHHGSQRIWSAMRTAVLAMLAEKQFDTMVLTATRVKDALRLQGDPLAVELLSSLDRDTVVRVIAASLPKGWAEKWPNWFVNWYALYTRPDGSTATEADVAGLESKLGAIGWGVSNMLKRLDVPDPVKRQVMMLAVTHQSGTVRWRAVHALGSWPTMSVTDVLLGRINDQGEALWVRYGALRSLLEAAGRGDSALRARVFEELSREETASLIASQPHLRREAIRALELDRPPRDWHPLAGGLMAHLWAASRDDSEREEVLSLARRMRRVTEMSDV